jgi:hypothetical protein
MLTPRDLGPPLVWDETDLDTLSQITPADAKAADALWDRDTLPALKGLLRAAPGEADA